MRDLRIRDLLDLARADITTAPDHLQKMYEWHFERSMTAAKAALGTGASVIAAVVVAYWKKELQVEGWQPVVALAASLLTLLYGAYRFRQIRTIHREYVAALALLTQLSKLAQFLKLYRRT